MDKDVIQTDANDSCGELNLYHLYIEACPRLDELPVYHDMQLIPMPTRLSFHEYTYAGGSVRF